MDRPQFGYRDLFDALTDEAVVLNGDGVIIDANQSWRRFCRENGGPAETGFVGADYIDICARATGPSSAEASVAADGIRRVLGGEPSFFCEYPCDSPTEKRWFEMVVAPLEVDGTRHVIITHRNISTRKREQHAAEAGFIEAELLSSLVATSHDAILSFDLDGRITTWNPAAERMYGYSREEAVGRSLEMLYPSGWPVPVTQYRDDIIAGKLRSFEVTRVAKSGEEKLIWVSAAPIRNRQGEVVMISNIHRDITVLQRAQEAREIMAREVLHRFKNLLTVVNAIQRQTQRNAGSLEEFGEIFARRISALSRSADLLLSGNWDAAPLADLVKLQLGPFRDGTEASFAHSGPDVLVGPSAVQVIGMALHELATNSAKYGALRSAEGAVEITWQAEDVGGVSHLRLTWLETGLAQDAPKSGGAGGFGRIVLDTLPASMLTAQPSHEVSAERVVWTVAIPPEHFSLGAGRIGPV